jgi:hypothetical protein
VRPAGWPAEGPAGVRFAPLGDPAARAAYAVLAEASPQATPFHSLAHADAACAAFGLAGEIVLARRTADPADDGPVSVGGVVFWRRRGPFRLAVVPPLTPYSGPLAAAPLSDALAEPASLYEAGGGGPLGAWVAAVARRADAAEFNLPPAFADARPFVWAGWRAAPRYTYAGPADWGGQTPRYVRHRVRDHAATRTDGTERPGGLRVRHDDEAAALVGRFAEGPFLRAGTRPPVPAFAGEALVRAHAAAGAARIAVVERTDGRPVGAVATVVDGRTGYVWTGSAEPGPGMLLLIVDTAERLVGEGVGRIDLLGANLAAVSAFKRRLGFPLVASVRVWWTGSRVLRLRDALAGR